MPLTRTSRGPSPFFSFMDVDPATVKYAQALPFVLLPVSSQLAALHTARAHADVPAACPRCGADPTFQRTRIARSKHPRTSQPTRMVLTTCTACGGVASTPFQSATIPSFSARKRTSAVTSPQLLVKASSSEVNVAPLLVSDQLKTAPTADEQTPVVRGHGPAAAKLGSASTKSKKKSSLQQMLERNREKEKHKSKATDAKQPSGLSAFLSTLQ